MTENDELAFKLIVKRNKLNKVWLGNVDTLREIMAIQRSLVSLLKEGLTENFLRKSVRNFKLR